MAEIPDDLLYSNSHEWVRVEGNGTATIGISDHAQSTLGKVTFVQLPWTSAAVVAGVAFGVIESEKAASVLYAPISGRIVSVNAMLSSEPGIVNRSPYVEGWLLKVAMVTLPGGLLTPLEYHERTR
jgi:glycine cleavage system H protein